MLIDLLYKEGLLYKGVVTYHQHRPTADQLQWKYYNGDILTIGSNLQLNTSSLFVGNSTVNAVINSSSIAFTNSTSGIIIRLPNTVQTSAWTNPPLLEIDGGDASTWLTA